VRLRGLEFPRAQSRPDTRTARARGATRSGWLPSSLSRPLRIPAPAQKLATGIGETRNRLYSLAVHRGVKIGLSLTAMAVQRVMARRAGSGYYTAFGLHFVMVATIFSMTRSNVLKMQNIRHDASLVLRRCLTRQPDAQVKPSKRPNQFELCLYLGLQV